MKKPIYLVAGARPNFVKLAPLVHELNHHPEFPFQIIHTGQHYDYAMSEAFFRTLGIPDPDVNLEVGSGTQGSQTARILERFEALLIDQKPRAVIVFGDVNSTIGCSLAAVKLGIPVVHVEAGLRSFDRSMPEEINRILTDAISDLLFVSELSGVINLVNEGADREKIYLVGNIMIDTLEMMLPTVNESHALERLGLKPGDYALLTMHRPSNVDQPETLRPLLDLFTRLAEQVPIVFPAHPRTQKQMEAAGFHNPLPERLRIIDPLDYLDTLAMQKDARMVLTDSGGMQEETTYLNVPCLTMRENTERPITVTEGTSELVGNDVNRIQNAFDRVLTGQWKKANPIPYWDGHTAARIFQVLVKNL